MILNVNTVKQSSISIEIPFFSTEKELMCQVRRYKTVVNLTLFLRWKEYYIESDFFVYPILLFESYGMIRFNLLRTCFKVKLDPQM